MLSKVSGALLLMAGSFFSSTAVATLTQNDKVASLINQRLSYMKDVSGYKANNHLAIEDIHQEIRVLSSSVLKAEKLRLDGESVKPFLQAQMDAAKAIQYRYRADWLSVQEGGWQPASLEQVRSKISLLNTKILTDISTQLSKGELFTDKTNFIKQLSQTHLKDSDKECLWYSLKKITLKKQAL
ncbi:chorismate mutase [Scandinavium goeteborgense]|uniref:chorismate mutase n=1 Tax=Scandinavium goeteborgense TaxID=1851514 RepID=UPI000F671C74|nr:chorismate mutase [Scandinavium goeteborgense]QKN79800.1 chorismate mutase [Scandinavium goeteborgense]